LKELECAKALSESISTCRCTKSLEENYFEKAIYHIKGGIFKF